MEKTFMMVLKNKPRKALWPLSIAILMVAGTWFAYAQGFRVSLNAGLYRTIDPNSSSVETEGVRLTITSIETVGEYTHIKFGFEYIGSKSYYPFVFEHQWY